MIANSFADLAGIVDGLVEEIEQGTEQLLEKASALGAEKAAEYFERAVYAGDNDVATHHKVEDKTTAVVTAEGNAVTFIEFGTGTMYPDAPADQNEPGFVRGTFGKGKGAHPPWVYYGEQGNAPDTIDLGSHKGGNAILTYGNPANLCLHGAKDRVQEALPKLAKEVFDK